MAAQLARRQIPSVILEGGGRLGQGVAFSTRDPAHLLNVPAAQMSAWADRPDDFVRIAGGEYEFAERRQFATYIRAILDDALASKCIEIRDDVAVVARPESGGWTVECRSGGPIAAGALVLANGNQPPEMLPGTEGLKPPHYFQNPWTDEAHAAIVAAVAGDAPVLILGTGLTMIDAVLSLDGAGHRGTITAVSRRGQVPHPHLDAPSAVGDAANVPLGSLTGLWRWIRIRAKQVEWHEAIDSLRPHSHQIWRSLGTGDRRRFLRHARPWWDIHRHRIAPQVGRRISELRDAGRLDIVAGRLRSAIPTERGIGVEIELRADGERCGEFALVLNCTGPLGRIDRTRDPLLSQLLVEGRIRADALNLSLEVDDHSRAGEGVWALGPLAKSAYWEIVAVPDIRLQVEQVADDIAADWKR